MGTTSERHYNHAKIIPRCREDAACAGPQEQRSCLPQRREQTLRDSQPLENGPKVQIPLAAATTSPGARLLKQSEQQELGFQNPLFRLLPKALTNTKAPQQTLTFPAAEEKDSSSVTYFFLSLSFFSGCCEVACKDWDCKVSTATFLRLKAFISSSSSLLFSSTFRFSSWCILFKCSNFSCS